MNQMFQEWWRAHEFELAVDAVVIAALATGLVVLKLVHLWRTSKDVSNSKPISHAGLRIFRLDTGEN